MERVRLKTLDADVGFVEEKIGRELFSQLGGVPRVAAFRTDAVKRAVDLYHEACERSAPEPELTAHGLLVLQRTLLACEDFGALAYALAEKPHWPRFTSYNTKNLDEVFSKLLDREFNVPRALGDAKR